MDYRYIYFACHDVAIQPKKATEESAGYDIAVIEGGWVWPGQCRLFDTGLQFFMYKDQTFFCQQRSSVFRKGLIVPNCPCDPDYRWTLDKEGRLVPLTWKILVRNVCPLPRQVRAGDRMAQIVLPPNTLFAWASELPVTIRTGQDWMKYYRDCVDGVRMGGLGSTGR